MTNPIRHHYLPQMYLKGFCKEDMLWVYDREKKEYRQQTPINTCLIKHYYSQEKDDGSRDTSVESSLSELESRVALTIAKIDNAEPTSDEEYGFLATFVALLITRVPGFESVLDLFVESVLKQMMRIRTSSEERIQESIRTYKEETGNDLNPQDLLDVVDGKFKITAHPNHRIRTMVELTQPLAELFIGKDWYFLQAPAKKSFVTSDNPVALISPRGYDPSGFYGVGHGTPGAVTVIPLSQKTCLLMQDGDSYVHFRQAQNDFIRRTNLLVTSGCDRFLIGRNRELLGSLVNRTNIGNKPRVPRVSMNNF